MITPVLFLLLLFDEGPPFRISKFVDDTQMGRKIDSVDDARILRGARI